MSDPRYAAPIKPPHTQTPPAHLLQREKTDSGTSRAMEDTPTSHSPSVQGQLRGHVPSVTALLQRAAAEPSEPLGGSVRERLEQSFGQDFSRIKVHSGPASDDAAQSIGARAYTLGTDIHLGAEAHSLAGHEFDRLLAHETVHTLQQGGQPVAPRAGLRLSSPSDTAEQDAKRIADSVFSHEAIQHPSRSLALRDAMRANGGPQSTARTVAPQLQRDLTGKHPVNGGEFDLNLVTESHPGAKNGMSGTIKFMASEKAPDSTNIRLLQIIRDEDLTTGKEYVWTGNDAGRNAVQTVASPGVDPGFHVDADYSKVNPRTKKTDADVSPYYRTYWPNAAKSQDGSKKGKTIAEASLWDYPGSGGNRRFSFETIAKAADTNHVYGTVMWGFTISDASKGTVEKERAVGRNVTLLTSDKAIEKFNEAARNPGASTAP
jgi:hypothetical protein